MKKFIAEIDNNGRIHISKILRASIGVTKNSNVEITIEENKLIITKSEHKNVCSLCESDKEIVKMKNGFLCSKCIKNIVKKNS